MTLLAPAFLAGLLAIGLPLWLHRLSSTNPNRRSFSSLMFLEPGEPRRVLAKKLQYLLLLALRIAALVLLALVFAQPAWWRSPEAAAGNGAQLHVLVIDASASMSHDARWARAESAAAEVFDGLSGGDRVQIIAAGRVAEVVTREADEIDVARQALATIEPTPFRVDYGQLMRALDGVLRAADMPVVLHMITDVQQSAMPARFAELAPNRPATITIHDVGEAEDANWAVESFTGSPLTGAITAQLRSFAADEAERTLRLELNGAVAEEREVTIEPGGRAEVDFGVLDLGPGANRVILSLVPGDELAFDDQRYLSLKRPEPRKVLVVTGGTTRGRDDDLFIRAALGTIRTLALELDRVSVRELANTALADYDFVIFTDLGVLNSNPSEADRIREYVGEGGGLLAALGGTSRGLGALPVTGHMLDSAAALRSGAAVSISRVDGAHPALRRLEGLRSARFTDYVGITPTDEDTILIELDSGAPLLVERELGAGRVFVYAATLDRDGNDLPVQPAFVPLLAGIANHLLGGGGFSSEAALGSTLSPRVLGMQGGQIFDPDGEPALGLIGGASDVVLEQPGFYEVVGGGRTEVVAVNPDPRESDLTRVEAGVIGRWEGLGFTSQTSTVAAAETGESIAVPLGTWLLWVLIAAFLMESVVGNWHLRVRRGIAT